MEKCRKRKIYEENRTFNDARADSFAFTSNESGLPICLICGEKLANHKPGMWKRKQSFFCGSGSAKNLPLPFSHRLFDLKSNLAKKFCPFPNVDETVKLHYKYQ